MANPYKSIVMRPLATAILDTRSSIDEVPPGSFRYKLNAAISPDGRLGRALGFQRFYKSVCSKNHDLHNQNISIADREPITTFFPSVSNEGVRRLFATTKTRIRVMNEADGEWDIIGDGFGLDGQDSLTQLRFRIAELQNKVVLTNNHDIPQIHALGSGTVAAIADLANVDNELTPDVPSVGGLTKAKVAISWNGFMFLMNNVEGGVRISSRIRWSHLNTPDFWQPAVPAPDTSASLADYQDLAYGERILAAIPLQGSLFVLTDSAIWRCNLSVSTDPGLPGVTLSCNRIYSEPKNKARCLAFPQTLVSDGISLWYLGADGVYRFTPGQDQNPERVEWVHRATGIVFRDVATRIDKNACESPVLEFRPATNSDDTAGLGELHLSWPIYNPSAEAVAEAEQPDCETYVATPAVPGSGLNRHTLVLNTKYTTSDYRDFGNSALVNFRPDASGVGDCNQQAVLLGADTTDFTIKELDVGAYREIYLPDSDTYENQGYYSRLVFLFPFDRPDADKKIQSFLVEHDPVDENDPAIFKLRIGTADQSYDPMKTSGCQVLWRTLKNEPLKCRYKMTAAQYQAKNILPHDPVSWAFLYSGKFLFVDLTITAADGSAPLTGLCSLSRFEVEAALMR